MKTCGGCDWYSVAKESDAMGLVYRHVCWRACGTAETRLVTTLDTVPPRCVGYFSSGEK